MEAFDSLEQMQAYPFPVFTAVGAEEQKARVEAFHAAGKAVQGGLGCSIWEQAWYLRGMENLFCDMMSEDLMAEFLLDRVTDIAVSQMESLARAGVDSVYFGDDIGMQHTLMMSEDLYCTWLKPRLKRLIDAARAIKPDIIIIYHSCGYIEEFIEGQKVVKVFCHEENAKKEFAIRNEELRDSATKAHTYASILMPIMGNIGIILFVT